MNSIGNNLLAIGHHLEMDAVPQLTPGWQRPVTAFARGVYWIGLAFTGELAEELRERKMRRREMQS